MQRPGAGCVPWGAASLPDDQHLGRLGFGRPLGAV